MICIVTKTWKRFKVGNSDTNNTFEYKLKKIGPLKIVHLQLLFATLINLNSKLNKNKIKFLIKNCYESGMKDTMRLIMYIRDRKYFFKK